jgi:predicted metal-dependent HD superfamily phosphohydrolase
VPFSRYNEQHSAEIAGRFASVFIPGSAMFCNLVEKLIIATKHNENCTCNDAKFVVDIDLIRFSFPNFSNFNSLVQYEYSCLLTEKDYWTGRKKVLESFLTKTRIYQTDYYYKKCESLARQNLEKAINDCEQRLFNR